MRPGIPKFKTMVNGSEAIAPIGEVIDEVIEQPLPRFRPLTLGFVYCLSAQRHDTE